MTDTASGSEFWVPIVVSQRVYVGQRSTGARDPKLSVSVASATEEIAISGFSGAEGAVKVADRSLSQIRLFSAVAVVLCLVGLIAVAISGPTAIGLAFPAGLVLWYIVASMATGRDKSA